MYDEYHIPIQLIIDFNVMDCLLPMSAKVLIKQFYASVDIKRIDALSNEAVLKILPGHTLLP